MRCAWRVVPRRVWCFPDTCRASAQSLVRIMFALLNMRLAQTRACMSCMFYVDCVRMFHVAKLCFVRIISPVLYAMCNVLDFRLIESRRGWRACLTATSFVDNVVHILDGTSIIIIACANYAFTRNHRQRRRFWCCLHV